MHSRLEAYLNETEARLRSLASDQRESDIAELRQHLESIAAAYVELNYTEDEAVRCAIERFGQSKTVAGSLVTASRRSDMRQTGSRLCYAGWGLFMLSLLLPTMSVFGCTLRGIQCALFVLSPSLPISPQPWGALYYHELGLANILMLFSPLLLTKFKQKRQLQFLTFLLSLSTASIIPLAFSSEWGIGFYAWSASFGLVTAGSFMRARRFGKQTSCTGEVKAL